MASSTSRLYWTDAGNDLGSGTVRDAPLSGSGEAQTLYTDPVGSAPRGLALDAATGAVYWGDPGLPALRTGSLTAGGSAESLFAAEAGPAYPAVLAAPRGEGAPQIAGSAAIGQALTCENGTWASNAPGANFYQAPQTYAYQWQLNGANIAGAQSSSFTPSDEGSYSCVVTATNAAGTAAQASAVAVIKASPPKASIVSPASGRTFEQGQVVTTSFSCAEGSGRPRARLVHRQQWRQRPERPTEDGDRRPAHVHGDGGLEGRPAHDCQHQLPRHREGRAATLGANPLDGTADDRDQEQLPAGEGPDDDGHAHLRRRRLVPGRALADLPQHDAHARQATHDTNVVRPHALRARLGRATERLIEVERPGATAATEGAGPAPDRPCTRDRERGYDGAELRGAAPGLAPMAAGRLAGSRGPGPLSGA